MEWIQELVGWIAEQDWLRLARLVKLASDYKDIFVIVAGLTTAIIIFTISSKMTKTVSFLKKEIDSIRAKLDQSSSGFRDQIVSSVESLKSDFTDSTETLDVSLQKIVSKRIEFLKIELDRWLTDEILPKLVASANGVSNVTREAAAVDYWNELRQSWEQSKIEIEVFLEDWKDAKTSRRRTKKYDSFSRNPYDKFIYKLFEDNIIDDGTCSALLEMNLIFNSRRNRKRIVTLQDIERFRDLRNQWLQAATIELNQAAAVA